MSVKKFESDAFEAIHSAASGLRKAGLISKTTMREYDDLCIAKTPDFSPADIVTIREKAKVSQPVFALYLNTSTSTVQKWETGQKKPGGAAAKLLQVVKKHGVEVLA